MTQPSPRRARKSSARKATPSRPRLPKAVQLAVDAALGKKGLTNLHLSILGYERVLKRIKDLAPKWVALGGGGYNIFNVARAWTLAWAVMNGVELEEILPESFMSEAAKMGMEERGLRGRPRPLRHSQNKENRAEMERVVHYIKRTVFPMVEG